MQTSKLLICTVLSVQFNNTSSAVSGGLALLPAFCQSKIEHQVGKCRLCERLDTEKHG